MKRKLLSLFLAFQLTGVVPFFGRGLVSIANAATGCTYPTIHTWVDKISGDYFTVADVNERTDCIEKLQEGPLRPNNGTAAAPAYAFQGGANLGFYYKAANTIGIATAGANVADIDSTGIIPAGSGIIKANRTSCTGSNVLLGDGTCSGQSSMFGSVGQNSLNNATTPNTQFDLVADQVTLRDTNNGGVVRHNPGSITNNISTAGPAANGRDQAGAFSANSWVHFYWIWNGTTQATVSSAAAPPTGPTLPTGYTHWSYACTVRLDGSSILLKTRCKGDIGFYEARQSALSGGTATVETAVSLTSLVPPNALATFLQLTSGATAAAGGTYGVTSTIRVVTGSNFYVADHQEDAGAAAQTFRGTEQTTVPNISQQVFYLVSGQTPTLDIHVNGYVLPNGGG